MRFHDLRHSTATLLLKAGVPLATVQKILRHTDPKITSEVYGHLDLEDMRAGLNRLALGLPPPPELPPFAAALLLGSARPKREGPDATRFPEGRQGLRTVGATGFEPATTCTPSAHTESGRRGTEWQRFATPRILRGWIRRRIPRRGTIRTGWHGKRCTGGARRWVRIAPDRRGSRGAPRRLASDGLQDLLRREAWAPPGLERHSRAGGRARSVRPGVRRPPRVGSAHRQPACGPERCSERN
jgi:integrase-like protein